MIAETLAAKQEFLVRRRKELEMSDDAVVVANSGTRRDRDKRELLHEVAWVRNLNGVAAVFVENRGDDVEVSVEGEYRQLSRSVWRALSPYWGD